SDGTGNMSLTYSGFGGGGTSTPPGGASTLTSLVGSLTLSGASTYTGATTITGGNLVLSFGGAPTAPGVLDHGSSGVLNLNGGNLQLNNASGTTSTQTFSTTNVNGGSNIIMNATSGATTLNLGTVVRTAPNSTTGGGQIAFGLPATLNTVN